MHTCQICGRTGDFVHHHQNGDAEEIFICSSKEWDNCSRIAEFNSDKLQDIPWTVVPMRTCANCDEEFTEENPQAKNGLCQSCIEAGIETGDED